MKKLTLLLLCLILLCSCSPTPQEAPTTAATETAVPTEPAGLYDPDSPAEAATGGAVRCYPLGSTEFSGMVALSDGFLLFTSDANTTKLTVLSGEPMTVTATRELNCAIFPEDACVRLWEGGFSFYDSVAGETLVLDSQLRDVSRIPAPEGLVGPPVLSYDRSFLYYFTDSQLRVLDLRTGISRLLKEMAYEWQYISDLMLNETVLACTAMDGSDWKMVYISTETGEILARREDMALAETSGLRYYVPILEGSVTSRVFGVAGSGPRVLTPRYPDAACFFLPESFSLLSMPVQEDGTILIDHYDLDACLRTAQLTLETDFYPWSFQQTQDGLIWFLNYNEYYRCTVLYSWDPSRSPTDDNTFYGGIYYTETAPDEEGLAECKVYAQQIGEKYGIEVLIHKDATKVQPWDYDMDPEHLVGVIQRELELLDRNLSRYPEGFIAALAERFDGISICIVRSLMGTAESGSLDSADGIQFMDNYRAYIALAANANTEYALYHEMCHLIDTMVISESGAYDRWEELNPKDFEYDYDYIANQTRDGSAYLQETNRSFIDTYSMSFPKEDRARILEYAMTEGNESYFRSTTMQAKLKLLCEGIREAFKLKKSPETFLWEQYLNTSLAYTG